MSDDTQQQPATETAGDASQAPADETASAPAAAEEPAGTNPNPVAPPAEPTTTLVAIRNNALQDPGSHVLEVSFEEGEAFDLRPQEAREVVVSIAHATKISITAKAQ